jgi:hypothetical protein
MQTYHYIYVTLKECCIQNRPLLNENHQSFVYNDLHSLKEKEEERKRN